MFAAASSIALGLLLIVFLFVGLSIYVAVVWQISARPMAALPEGAPAPPKNFGLADAILAAAITAYIIAGIAFSASRPAGTMDNRALFAGVLLTLIIVFLIALLLKLRGIDIDSIGGFSKTSLKRAVSTGIILLLAGTPLILLAEALTQSLFGSGSSRQEIVDLFNSSQTLQQRVMIIVLAVVVAPMSEEFIFRFFIYGVVRRYFGIAIGLVFNAALFAAAHNHLPSAAPLFVLGACFTLAYEWSGSILVSMAMHTLFNSVQLIFLAFPNLFQQ